MTVSGRIIIWRANNSREVGAFRQPQLSQILSEVGHAGFRESANAKAPAVAQVHFVGVQLENLLLVEALLELDRNHGFGELPPPVAIGRQKERARHLHRNGAGALIVLAAVPHVGPRRPHDADEVKASVLEEALVLGRKNRVHQHYRQVFIAHWPPLLTRAVEKIGNEFRFDFRGIQFSAAGKRFDGSNALSPELNRQSIVPCEIGKFRRPDIDGILLRCELANGVCILDRTVSHAGEIRG